jgi:peptidylamidoglycolate lyase
MNVGETEDVTSFPMTPPASRFSRRKFFRTAALVLGAIPARTLFAADERELPESHVLDEHWPALSPEAYPERCQIAGVAIAKDGNILALNRGENHWMPTAGLKRQIVRKPAVLVIDPKTGALVNSWGAGIFTMPHQIHVDREGNVWVVDCGSNMVFKFDASGAPLLKIGGSEIGFNMPTDVALLSDGSFVVSDGYVNARVVKFDPVGKRTATWGTKGKQPLQFQTPHSVTVDDADLLYVADRENHRVQVLNARGELRAIWTDVERPLTVRFSNGSIFVLSNLEAAKGVVRQFDRNGVAQAVFHTKPVATEDDFEWPHGLAVNGDGSMIYVGFTLTSRRLRCYRHV